MEKILKMFKEGNKLVVNSYHNWVNNNIELPLDENINTNIKNGSWGSNLDMFYICMVHGVNIVCISNRMSGLETFDAYQFLQLSGGEEYIINESKTCYIYHYIHGNPFEPSNNPNHFGTLSPSPLKVYTGNPHLRETVTINIADDDNARETRKKL